MGRKLLVVVASMGLVAASLVPAQATVEPGGNTRSADISSIKADKSKVGRYVVVMDKDPLVKTYGRDRVNTTSARRRATQLRSDHDRALRAIGKRPSDKTYSYTVSLNGFAVALTDAQAVKMARQKGVVRILRDVKRFKTTDASPDFLGLTGAGGPWAQGLTGEGVVVGVIDTGIWPEHPSFADDGSYPAPPVALEDTPDNPACNFGNVAHNPQDAPFTCTNKLVGARQMLETYRSFVGADPDEYDSARDDDGHGTHTASTSAGNQDVPAEIFGIDRGTVSGIAPRAHVIAYKALGNLGGFTSDLAAAIDQAVEDGVDVINYSIGGGASLTTADDIAFLFAADAGVFVAASAGNSGPGPGTIGGPASVPWLTAVGASTQPRFFQGTVLLTGAQPVRGASVTQGTKRAQLVDAEDAGGDLCVPGTLDPAKVTGRIVLCRRGQVGRAEKSFAVSQAGGIGMILYNTTNDDNLFTDNHFVPSVHLDLTEGLKVKSYIDSRSGATAQLVGNQTSTFDPAPSMTIFSSRGPDPVAEDIIKPDITAPGLQILAGASPTPDPGAAAPGQLFQAIAGTSMSSPHMAGAFALVKQAHPDWSAAAAKSAVMTTAYQDVRDNDRVSQATPFGMGSGHVDMAGQKDKGTPFDPGLVYEAGFLDYLGFLCDADRSAFANPEGTCAALEDLGIPTEAENLNYPSIGVASVPGTRTITRTVTSVAKASSAPRVFTAQVDAPAGYTVTVTPNRIRLLPGQSATFEVRFDNVSAPLDEWRFGSLNWKSGAYDVRSPLAVKAVDLEAPAEVSGTGENGSVDIPVTFGYTGSYTAGAHGLEPATVISDNVPHDPDQIFDPADGFSDAHDIVVNDAHHLRIAMPPDAVDSPDIDIDLYLFDPNGDLVASSTLGGTDELIDIAAPTDGTWTIYVHGWNTGGEGTSADYDLYHWVVPSAAGTGNLSITSAPPSAVKGESGVVTASWTGAPPVWNLGAVSHNGPTGLMGLTLVDVDNRP
jgi:subtilisin family serine protease